MNGEQITILNNKEQKLAAWLHKGRDDKKIVILVHGYPSNCHWGQKDYAQTLADAGISSLRFDQRGCGESQGDFNELHVSAAVNDLKSVILWAKEKGYEEIGLFGSSFGAAVAVIMASQGSVFGQEKVPGSEGRQGSAIKRILLRSPAANMATETEWGDDNIIAQWKDKGYLVVDENRDGEAVRIPYSFHEDALKNIAYEPAQKVKARTLIIHGTQDKSVPLAQAKRLAELMPNAMLIILEGANHSLKIDGDSTEFKKLLVEWFDGSWNAN